MRSAAKNLATASHVGCLTLYVAMGSEAKPLQKEIERFLDNNGIEWTTNRLKAIWNASNHLKNGDTAKASQVYQDNSISYHKDSFLPKGEIGNLVRHYVEAERPKVIRKYAAALRYYTSLSLEGELPTRQQSQKAVKSISERYHGDKDPGMIPRLLSHSEFRRSRMSHYDRKVIAEARMPKGTHLHSNSYYYHTIELDKLEGEAVKDLPYGEMMLSLISESWIPTSLEGDRLSDLARQTQFYEYGIDSGRAGRVLGMQQNGCKLRVVAQPTAAEQRAFLPLHKALQYAYRTMYSYESCVEDQVKGAYVARDHLNSGHELFSVDLSSATDRFPRAYSEQLLNLLGLERFSRALEEVCNRPWENANLLGPKELYYETGQPMGLYGSFPLFHLSNLTVADAAVGQARLVSLWCKQDLVPFKDGTFFKVLGDDIILSDPIVADQYTHIMSRLGVEVSPTKTFSGHVAEFAGFMVVPSHDGYTAFRPYKHPTGEWITNPLDFVHAMGSNVTTLSDRWTEIFRAYSSTIGQRTLDLAPMLNDDSEEPYQISGKEPWLESLQVRLQSDILNLKDSSRIILCVQDYLKEQSGYNFCNQAFSDYVKSVVDPIYSAPRKNDVAFTPETAIKQSKKEKRDVKSELMKRFWSDPLNAKWRYEIEHSISTIGLPLQERTELATVRSKFQNLTSERRTVPPEIFLDRSR